jgi:hypothetical protein
MGDEEDGGRGTQAQASRSKKMSIMDQRRLEEERERREVEEEFMHPRWSLMWSTEYPPRFDKLCVAPILQKLVDDDALPRSGRCLVPGCGRGYDVTALASQTRYCLGVDIVQEAIAAAQDRLEQLFEMSSHLGVDPSPPMGSCEFKCQSFFSLDTDHPENLFDLVYDYCFLSVLDPRIHKNWAAKMSKLVKVGGELVTVIWPIMLDKKGGPPFNMSIDLVRSLLMPAGFEPVDLYVLPPELCHTGRDGSGGDNCPRTALGRWRRIELADDYDHEFDG